MVTTYKRVRRTAVKLSIVAFAAATFGAAVVAAPFVFVPRAQLVNKQVASLAPLASGPAMQLAKAGPGESEDCVRVTSMTGPDRKQYPTRGIVCGGGE
jgi:ABC-type iron transport system FetAB permease component